MLAMLLPTPGGGKAELHTAIVGPLGTVRGVVAHVGGLWGTLSPTPLWDAANAVAGGLRPDEAVAVNAAVAHEEVPGRVLQIKPLFVCRVAPCMQLIPKCVHRDILQVTSLVPSSLTPEWVWNLHPGWVATWICEGEQLRILPIHLQGLRGGGERPAWTKGLFSRGRLQVCCIFLIPESASSCSEPWQRLGGAWPGEHLPAVRVARDFPVEGS